MADNMNRAERRRQQKLAKKASGGVANAPTLAIQQALDLGVAHHNAGRLSEAESIYQQILQADPNQPVALCWLGVIAHQMGENDLAVDLISKALAISPDFAEAHSNLGLVLQDLGRFEGAVASYHKALANKPNFAAAQYNLGNAFQEQGRLDEAIASYHKALAIKPEFSEVHNNLGNAIRDQGKPDEAIASFCQALVINSDFVMAHINHGFALQELGRSDEAEASYQKALQIDPANAEAHYNLHVILLDTGDIAGALKCMQSAVATDPNEINYRFILGMLSVYSGNPLEAVPHFDLVEKGANSVRAKLDAWRYIKAANEKIPRITGTTGRALKLGIDAAVNDGLVLEFGVRFGTSIRQISGLVDQDVHGFDSFEGLPEAWHLNPKGSYSTKGNIPTVPENVILHEGWFKDTLPNFVKKYQTPIRFINIDCDIYSATKTILELLAEQFVPGTVIVFDEYIGNEFWREDEFKAFQEAVLKYGWKYEYLYFSFTSNQVVVRIS